MASHKDAGPPTDGHLGIVPPNIHTTPTHTCRNPWHLCWLCHRSLGCRVCAASTPEEVYCRLCRAYGTPEALAFHGPDPYGAPLASYPLSFRAAYVHARPVEGEVPVTRQGREASAYVSGILDRWKEKALATPLDPG